MIPGINMTSLFAGLLLIFSADCLYAQILHVDSVQVDSVWNSDSSWYDNEEDLNQRTSRDCRLTFFIRGEGLARVFVAVSIDSGKSWTSDPETLVILNNALDTALEAGKRAAVNVRVPGGDRPGVAFKVTARQGAPVMSGSPQLTYCQLTDTFVPGQAVKARFKVNREKSIEDYCPLSKIYWDARCDGSIDDSTSGEDMMSWSWLVEVYLNDQKDSVAVRAVDKNGLSGKPETLYVQFVDHVVDTTPPVIILFDSSTVIIHLRDSSDLVYYDDRYSAIDNLDGDITDRVKESYVIANLPGIYKKVYTVSDMAGNSDTAFREIIVYITEMVDTVPPVITIRGLATVYVNSGDAYFDLGAEAYDIRDAAACTVSTTGLPVNTSVTGTYTITYSAIDKSGNTATKTRTVVVQEAYIVDLEAPVITFNPPDTAVLEIGEHYIEPGYSAIDNVDGDITSAVTVHNPVNSAVAGVYIITYTVTDNAGNFFIRRRFVIVGDIPAGDIDPPVIILSGSDSMTIALGFVWVEPGFVAVDENDGNITNRVIISGTPNTAVEGAYTITYTVTDDAGNTSAKRRMVVVSSTAYSDMTSP